MHRGGRQGARKGGVGGPQALNRVLPAIVIPATRSPQQSRTANLDSDRRFPASWNIDTASFPCPPNARQHLAAAG